MEPSREGVEGRAEDDIGVLILYLLRNMLSSVVYFEKCKVGTACGVHKHALHDPHVTVSSQQRVLQSI